MKALLLAAVFFFLLLPATAKANMAAAAIDTLAPLLPLFVIIEIVVLIIVGRKYLKIQISTSAAVVP